MDTFNKGEQQCHNRLTEVKRELKKQNKTNKTNKKAPLYLLHEITAQNLNWEIQ